MNEFIITNLISLLVSIVRSSSESRKFKTTWFLRDVIKIKKQEIINPFETLVQLVIRTAEDLSFLEIFSLIGFFVL